MIPHLLEFLRTLTWVRFFFFGRKNKSKHVPAKLLILSPSDQQIRLPHIQLLILALRSTKFFPNFWFVLLQIVEFTRLNCIVTMQNDVWYILSHLLFNS